MSDFKQIGIDYYITSQPRKAIHLQKKITALLSDPDNLRILDQNSKAQKQSPGLNKNQLNHKKLNE